MKGILSTGIIQQAANNAGGGSYNTYVQAAIDFADANTPSPIGVPTAYMDALSTLMDSIEAYNSGALITNGEFLNVYAYDATNNEFATINLLDPTFAKATIINSPVFTAKKGVKGDGVNGYIEHDWIAADDAINVTDDNAMAFAYVVDVTATGSRMCGVRGNNNGEIELRKARISGESTVKILSTIGNFTDAEAENDGSLGVLSDTPTEAVPYVNGVAQTTLTGLVDETLPDAHKYTTCAYNSKGTIVAGNAHTIVAEYIGKADAGGQLVLHNAVAQYLTDIAAI